MVAKKITVKVKETGKTINVYRLTNGDYANWDDQNTIYKKEELIFN